MRGIQLTFDQPGEEAAVTDEGLPFQGIPVHVLQLALLGTGVSAGEGRGALKGIPSQVHTYVYPLPHNNMKQSSSFLLPLLSFLQAVS